MAQSKVTYHRPDAEELAAEAAALADAESMGFLSDPFASSEAADVIGILGETAVVSEAVEESDDAS